MGENDESGQRRTSPWNFTRRKLLAGSLLVVGSVGQFVDGGTVSAFQDSISAEGTLGINGDPTLNYQISDLSQNSNAKYRIMYQVEWASDFAEIEIQVENLDAGTGATFTRSTYEGAVEYPRGGGAEGGAGGNTYRFTFRVKDGDGNRIIPERVTEDIADGSDTGEGDMGNANSAELVWAILDDNSDTGSTGSWRYDIYYEVKKLDDFEQTRAHFRNLDADTHTQTDTNQDSPIGKLSYSQGKGNPSFPDYKVDVKVENGNGVVVDSHQFPDVPNGVSPQRYGDPAEPDSPTLEGFTLIDNSTSNETEYTVDFSLSGTTRLNDVVVNFTNMDNNWASKTKSGGSESSEGTVTYSEWVTGDEYRVTVDVMESRNGITFPVSSGTLTDTAGSQNAMTWPEDAD